MCGLDQFLGRPKPFVESYKAEIVELKEWCDLWKGETRSTVTRLEEAEIALNRLRREKDELEAENAELKRPANGETYWLIHFEDADRQQEVFTSEEPARLRYAAASESWNCTLFKSVTPIPRSGHLPKAESATEVAQQFGIAGPRRE
jgi:hypothetical protein